MEFFFPLNATFADDNIMKFKRAIAHKKNKLVKNRTTLSKYNKSRGKN